MERKNVLLVEDNQFLSEVYTYALKEAGYTVDAAFTGSEGHTKATKGGWDLILLDIVLPEMDGFDIVKKLQDTPPTTPNKNLVFLTSLDNEHEMQRAQEMSIPFIVKSDITPGDLVEKVKPYLQDDQDVDENETGEKETSEKNA